MFDTLSLPSPPPPPPPPPANIGVGGTDVRHRLLSTEYHLSDVRYFDISNDSIRYPRLSIPSDCKCLIFFTAPTFASQVSGDNTFNKDGYFTWIFLGSQRLSHLFTALIIIGFLLITCFPIWPRILKVQYVQQRYLLQ